MKSIYIHIPFCRKICNYCDFSKVIYNKAWVEDYLRFLAIEILDKYDGEEMGTLYVGGGTPSAFSVEELKVFFNIIRKLNLNEKVEFSFEMNVEDIELDKLLLLKANGVNRVSVGVQTFNLNYQRSLGRVVDDNIVDKIKLLQSHFSNVSVDLMYGFFNQSIVDVEKDLEVLLGIKPSHVSIYNLILEQHTKLNFDNEKESDDDIAFDMYKKILDTLEEKGYKRYEVSNFCTPGFESKHNLNYWNNDEYFGFGLGAHGFIDGFRYENTRSLTKYLAGEFLLNEDKVTLERLKSDELMLGLRKTSGINLNDYYVKYKTRLEDDLKIIDVVKEGYLINDGDSIYLNPDYFFLMNEILIKLI